MGLGVSSKRFWWSVVLVGLIFLLIGCTAEDQGVTVRANPEAEPGVSLGLPATPTPAGEKVVEEAEPGPAGEGETGEAEPAPATATEAPPAAPEVVIPTPAVFDLEPGAGVLALGDPEAPVTIVEFSDYQCPYCLRYAQETWPTLKERYVDAGRVYYVFKDFPLAQLHPQAAKAAEAARCAAQVGGNEAYWAMHDRLFADQQAWAGNAEHLAMFKGYAEELGLDQSAFDACLDGGEFADEVQADLSQGARLGVNGTPTFFVDGYPFSGARPIEFFDQAIALAENGQLDDAIAQAMAQAQQEAEPTQPPAAAPADVPVGDAPSKGDPDAPITIVEYSDYQCPYCRRYFRQTLPKLLENYVETGQVRYVFKDFPLNSIHPQAAKAAEAARCAAELGGNEAYWSMHDQLFAGQGEWAGQSSHAEVFKGYAGELGLDQAAFDACLDSGRYAQAVQADRQEGARLGVSGTPAFFINEQLLRGSQPYAAFEQIIEELLAEE